MLHVSQVYGVQRRGDQSIEIDRPSQRHMAARLRCTCSLWRLFLAEMLNNHIILIHETQAGASSPHDAPKSLCVSSLSSANTFGQPLRGYLLQRVSRCTCSLPRLGIEINPLAIYGQSRRINVVRTNLNDTIPAGIFTAVLSYDYKRNPLSQARTPTSNRRPVQKARKTPDQVQKQCQRSGIILQTAFLFLLSLAPLQES